MYVSVRVFVCVERERKRERFYYMNLIDLTKLWETVSVKLLPVHMILEPEIGR